MRHMRKRQHSGQSAVLLAFMILVLVAMVALSVDVGNAYGQQRRVQSMSNAGAMAGMASALAQNTNNGVWTDVQRSLSGNRAQNNTDYTYTVDYILEDGTVELLGEWNGEMEYVPNGNAYPPADLGRVQVTMTENVKTKFAGVVGRPSLGVVANGVACLGDYGFGVYPIAIPNALSPSSTPSGGHAIFLSNGQTLATTDARWGKWDQMQGMFVRIPLATGAGDFRNGIHAPFLNWGGEAQTIDGKTYTAMTRQKGDAALATAMLEPGTLHDGFMEAASPDAAKPNVKPIGILQRGDWISGEPGAGVKASMQNHLNNLISKKTVLMLPMYDASGGVATPLSSYHMVNMGMFQLSRANVVGNGAKHLDLRYLGEANASPTECASESPPDPETPPKEFNIKGEVKLNNRVWRTGKSSGTTTYDIVIVMDTSESMSYDWNDRKPGESGHSPSKARVNDAKKVIRDFVQNYDITSDNGDPDARIAFITFGGSTAVDQSTGFQRACAAALIASNCGSKTAKWATIQTKAAAMTVSGLTPGPIGFEAVETLLQNKRTPPAGKKYKQIVVFATDGVFNICGKDKGERSCPYGNVASEGATNYNDVLYNPAYNAVSGRPVWQAQQVAGRIKNSGANIFIIALTPTCRSNDSDCFNPAGLSDMSSGAKYYYRANDASALTSIYDIIRETIVYDTCVPNEITQQAANAPVVLTKPDSPNWRKDTTTDSSGMFQFTGLAAGEYIVKVEPSVQVVSPEDGFKRTYSRTRNGRSLSEEGQASVYINPQFPNGATVSAQLLLSLGLDDNGTPHNGCTMPAP